MHASGPVMVYVWPEQPTLPPRGQVVLVRVAVAEARDVARRELRAVLRRVLAAWTGLAPGQLPLEETPRGPVWRGLLEGLPLDISLSYSPDEAWIGFLRGGWIGIDVSSAAAFAEVEDVARHYLAPVVAAGIRATAHPARAFAVAWTERESRLKCLKQGLVEWTAGQAEREAECLCHRLRFSDRLVGAVSWRNQTVVSRS
jgi:4'-phosphopantetheinyl transferase